MNNLFTLLKIDILNSLALMQYRNTKKNKAKSKGPVISSILSVIFVAFIMGFYSVMLSFMAHESGNDGAIIVIGVGIGGFSTLLMTFGRAYSTLFKSKDYEMLSSMPINTNTIVSSKIISLLVVNYLYFLMPFLPCLVFYYLYTGVNLIKILTGISTIILGPFVATVFCSALSFIIGSLLAKSKYKNALQTVSTVIIFLVVFVGVFSLEMSGMEGDEIQYNQNLIANLENVFKKGYFPGLFVSNAMNGSYLDLVWFLLVSIVPFVLFVYLISKNYVYINSNGNTTYKNTKFKLEDSFKKEEKNPSAFKALLKKEAKLFFSISIYCMNSIVGPIMSTIMIVAYSIMFKKEMTVEEVGEFRLIALTIYILATAFCMGMFPSTGASVSIEGKNFWILKVSPIKTETIFLAKSALYIIVCIPFIIINTIIGFVFWPFKFYDAIFMILVPIAIVIGSTFISLWINTCKYKLDWTNPAQVVKSSTGTLLTMLVSFAFDALIFIPTIILAGLNLYSPIAAFVIGLLYVLIAYLLLFKNGKKRFENIQI